MPGCNVTRRDLLRWTALAVAAPAVAPNLLVRAAQAGSAGVTPANLELVTLTEDRAVFTWFTGATGSGDELGLLEPLPADAEVRWGTDPSRLDRVASSERTDTPYHVVQIDGLEPGRTYWYEAWSNGLRVPPTTFAMIEGDAVNGDGSGAGGPADPEGPFRFTTPMPPPGRFLFSVVLCNDLHLGETVAGLVGAIPSIRGIEQVPGSRPYPTIMAESLVDDALALGASYLVAAGDITSEAEPPEVREARALLDRFGERGRDWWAVRGNHDRAHEGDAWASCSLGPHGGHDCFFDGFHEPGETTWSSTDLHGLRVIGIDTYDKPGTGGNAGELGPDQLDWLRTELAGAPDQPTLVFGHHPLVVEASPYPVVGGTALDADQAAALAGLYAQAPGVFLHHAGHTHRNRRSGLADAPGVVHQEVAAVKEYPGGFTLLRVHEGGYALNFHKSTSDEARAWSQRSRAQIGGTWPQFSLGARVSDRNVVVERDLSGISAPPAKESAAPAARAQATKGEGEGSEGDGPPMPLLAAAGVTVAAAGGAYALRLRRRTEGSTEPG